MNICGTNISYNSASHFKEVASLVAKLRRNIITLDEFKSEITKTFSEKDAKAILDWNARNADAFFPYDFAEAKSHIEISQGLLLKDNPFEGSISYYYSLFGGNPKMDTDDLIHDMTSEFVFRLVYNPKTKRVIHPDMQSHYYGYTNANRILREFKVELAEEVIDKFQIEGIEYDIDDDVEYTLFINSVIMQALSKLKIAKMTGADISKEKLDTFIKLARFDELALSSKIIKLNVGEEYNGVFSKNRYTFTGETVYSKSIYEEHADIKDYTSKLVTSILDAVECSTSPLEDGTDTGVKITLDGFNYAMNYVNDWYEKQYPDENKHKLPYSTRVARFITHGSGSLSKFCREILYGLQKHIFNESVPYEIQNLFEKQAETFVQSSYIEYMYDNIKIDADQKSIPGVTFRHAKDKIENNNKFDLAKRLVSKLRYYEYLKNNKRNISTKVGGFSIVKAADGFTVTRTIGSTITHQLRIRNKIDNSGYIIDITADSGNEEWAKFLNELLDLPLLDKSELDKILLEGESLISNFSQMVAVACDGILGNFDKVRKQNKISLSAVLPFIEPSVGFINALLLNEVHTVVKDQHGHTIPSNQLVSFGYRIQYLIDDIILSEGDHIQQYNIFVNKRAAIKGISMRQSVKIGDVIKDVNALGFNEIEQLKICIDMYQRLLKSGRIVLQPMTYADKTRHLLYEIDLKQFNIGTNPSTSYSADYTIKKLSQNFLYTGIERNSQIVELENNFIDTIRNVRFKTLEKSARNLLNRFSKIGYGTVDDLTSDNVLVKLQKLNTLLQNTKLTSIRNKFALEGIDFYQENDVNSDKDGNITGINLSLLSALEIFSSTDKTKRYFNYKKHQYLQTLDQERFKLSSIYDPSLKSLYFPQLGSEKSQWMNEDFEMKNGQYRWTSTGEINGSYTEDQIKNGEITVELNPMINAYFWAFNLYGEQLRTLTMGLDHNIGGKASVDFDSDVHERFVAHTKRAMGQGSTIMKLHPQKFGTAKIVDACLYDDIKAGVFNLKGKNDSELVFDGGGHISAVEFILEQWSLPGNTKTRGDIMKSIIQAVDSNGCLNQIKWAGTTLSNFRRRGCLYSDTFSLDTMFKKMHSRQISVTFNPEKYYGKDMIMSPEGHPLTCTESIYFYDIESGKHYKILSVKSHSANTIKRTIAECDENGNVIGEEQTRAIPINNLADLHELFGGKYCKIYDENEKSLKYSEVNNIILANIVCDNKLKDRFIAYAIPKSAYKVGMHNVNNSDVFSPFNTNRLWTISIDISHSGMQLDAGHEVSDGRVSEGSQMISLVTESGFATDIVDDLYSQIAEVTKSGLSKFEDQSKIKTVLSRILADSLQSSSGNVTSISDDFIKHLINQAKDQGVELQLYFSSPSIRSKFSTAVCACINRYALRRKFSGLGAVQTPSYDQMTIVNVGGYNMTMDDLCDEYRDSLGSERLEYLFKDPTQSNPNKLSIEYFESLRNIRSKSNLLNTESNEGIPVMEQIRLTGAGFQDIDFEDTIVVLNETGTEYTAVKISDISTFDKYRRYRGVLYKWNTRPRNLVQQLSKLEVLDENTQEKFWITLYDLKEYRIAAYLSQYKAGLKKGIIDLNEDQLAFLTANGEVSLINGRAAFIANGREKEFMSMLDGVINKYQKLLQEKLNAISSDLKTKKRHEWSTGLTIISHDNKGAQLMAANPWLKLFNLKSSDSLYKIKKGGETFFKERLTEFYEIDLDVPETGYDAVLYTTEGEPILIQLGSDNTRLSDDLSDGTSFTKVGNNIIYNGEEIGSSIGLSEFVYHGTGGTSYKVWRISDPGRLNSLMKTKLFSHVKYNASENTNWNLLLPHLYPHHFENGTIKTPIKLGNFLIEKIDKKGRLFVVPIGMREFTGSIQASTKESYLIANYFNKKQENILNTKINVLAKQRFIAFNRMLTCIGMRIPSQALSSVAKCEIVGFTGGDSNDVYLPRVLTWVAGSDYDIDKFYIMMYEALSDGTLPNLYLHNSNFDPLDLRSIKKKVSKNQSKISLTVSAEPSDDSKTFCIYNEDVDRLINGDADILDDIIDAINAGKSIVAVVDPTTVNTSDEGKLLNNIFNESVYDIFDVNNQDIRQKLWHVESIINEFITSDPNEFSQKYREIAEKNMVVDDLSRILSEPSTQIALQSVVSADEGKNAADQMDKKYNREQKKDMSFDNPASVTRQQINNMVGKIGIAATAVAKKAYDGIAFSFNSTIVQVAKNILKNGYVSDQDVAMISSLQIERKAEYGGGIISIANVNFDPVINAINTVYELKPIDVKAGALRNMAEMLKESCNKTYAVDYFSTMMTLATDNAKELLLARLNAIDENIDLYTYLFATGKTFTEAADIMMSPVFSLVQRLMSKNIFKPGSKELRQDLVIDFLRGKSHLPTVNRTLLKDVLVGNIKGYVWEQNLTVFSQIARKYSDKFAEVFGTDPETYFNNYKYNPGSNWRDITREEKFVLDMLTEYPELREIVWSELRKKVSSQQLLDEYDDSIMDYDQSDFENYFSSLTHVGYNDKKLSHTVQKQMLKKYLEEYFEIQSELQMIQYNDSNSPVDINQQLDILADLSAKANEFATLGRKIFKINQGMDVGDYEEWQHVKSIENAINSEFIKKNQSFKPIDWNRFLNDDMYAEEMIRQYDRVKRTVNILRVVRDNTNMLEMLRGASTARSLLYSAKITDIVHKIAKNIFSNNTTFSNFDDILSTTEWTYSEGMKPSNYKKIIRSLTKEEYKGIANTVNSFVIFSFFNHLEDNGGFTIKLTNAMEGKYKKSKDNKITYDSSATMNEIQLHTLEGMMNFKQWMDSVVFPKLKQNDHLTNFGNALQFEESYNKEWEKSKFRWSIDRDIASAKPGTFFYKKKSKLLKEFGNVARTHASSLIGINTDLTIGDLLYLYNLIVHHDVGGLTFLFADLASSKNPSDWINNFQQYIKDIDYEKIKPKTGDTLFNVTPNDVVFNIVTADNAYKFNAQRLVSTKGWMLNGSECEVSEIMFDVNAPFDLPSIYSYNFREWTGFKINPELVVDQNSIEITHELISHMNSILMGTGITIYEIDDSFIAKHAENKTLMFENMSKHDLDKIASSVGFVYGGNVYINTDQINGDNDVIIHELMHLICANLHYNPKYDSLYHKMLNDLWITADDSVREKYKKDYPNKHTSDLKEEFFVDTIGKMINDKFNNQMSAYLGNKSVAQLKADVFDSLKTVFGLAGETDIALEDFMAKFTCTKLTDVINLFRSGLFNFNNHGFTTTAIGLSQELATIKDRLLESKEIIEECKEW